MKATSILSDGIHAARHKKIDKHIEIVSTNVSGLGSMGKQSRDSIYKVLKKHYLNVGITTVDTLADLDALAATQPDLVFLGVKYIPSDSDDPRGINRIWLSTYLGEQDIAHTGSSRHSHRLESNKPMAKQRVHDAGLKTSPFYISKQSHPDTSHPVLSFPLFVKPVDRGGGQGIDSKSVVTSQDELQSKIKSIASNLQADSLVEEYLPGREFSVAILKNEFSDKLLTLPLELIAPLNENGQRILSGLVKSSDTEQSILVTDPAVKNRINDLAVSVFHALGARDYGRIDIRLDKFGTPHFIEANLIPSLIEGYGNFPKACQLNIGLDHEAIVLAIVSLGLKRGHEQPSINEVDTDHSEFTKVELAPLS